MIQWQLLVLGFFRLLEFLRSLEKGIHFKKKLLIYIYSFSECGFISTLLHFVYLKNKSETLTISVYFSNIFFLKVKQQLFNRRVNCLHLKRYGYSDVILSIYYVLTFLLQLWFVMMKKTREKLWIVNLRKKKRSSDVIEKIQRWINWKLLETKNKKCDWSN